jgi:hypothetical protein
LQWKFLSEEFKKDDLPSYERKLEIASHLNIDKSRVAVSSGDSPRYFSDLKQEWYSNRRREQARAKIRVSSRRKIRPEEINVVTVSEVMVALNSLQYACGLSVTDEQQIDKFYSEKFSSMMWRPRTNLIRALIGVLERHAQVHYTYSDTEGEKPEWWPSNIRYSAPHLFNKEGW